MRTPVYIEGGKVEDSLRAGGEQLLIDQLSSKYSSYLIMLHECRATATKNDDVAVYLSTDGGVSLTTSHKHIYHYLLSGAAAFKTAGSLTALSIPGSFTLKAGSSEPFSGHIRLYTPMATGTYTSIDAIFMYKNAAGLFTTIRLSGQSNTAESTNAMVVDMGNSVSGNYSLYGYPAK